MSETPKRKNVFAHRFTFIGREMFYFKPQLPTVLLVFGGVGFIAGNQLDFRKYHFCEKCLVKL